MRENAALIAAAEAHQGSAFGTPAGNSPLSQEQHAWLRRYSLSLEHLTMASVYLPRWASAAEIPPEMLSQNSMVAVPAPIVGVCLVLLPDGSVVSHPNARLS